MDRERAVGGRSHRRSIVEARGHAAILADGPGVCVEEAAQARVGVSGVGGGEFGGGFGDAGGVLVDVGVGLEV